TEDAGAPRLAAFPDQHGGVLVELDVRAVGATTALRRAHDPGTDDVALLDARAGQRILDRADDDVADPGVPPTRATEHPDAEDLLRTRVVGDPKSRFLLDHLL